MVIRQRAILDADKLLRRTAILDAAQTVLLRYQGELASVDAIARQARLAKGTVYLYFKTKEEIYLAVHELRSHEFFDNLDALLERAGKKTSLGQVTRTWLACFERHPSYPVLASRCFDFEHKVDFDTLIAFRAGIARRLQTSGAKLEKVFAGLRPGAGAKLLILSYSLTLGLWRLTEPTPHRERMLKDRSLQVFRMDFAGELEAALISLWRGVLGNNKLT
jgi:AcrR family transcriptional regulator